MSYQKLVLLAPCHGLEDFPLYHTGEDAASLLACWTALWHPLLLDQADGLPKVERCDYPPEDLQQALLVVPLPCEAEMDADLPEKAKALEARLLRGYSDRNALLSAMLEPFGERAQALDEDLVADFLAFGFAFLQVELLTQQMRYASSIDQTRIERALQDAAAAAIAGNAGECREKLTLCHDALADERSHYYPVDVYFLDLTMLASSPATLGAALTRQLGGTCPMNVLASGQVIEQLAEQNAEALALLKERLSAGTLSIAGGEWEELPLPLLDTQAFVDQLERGGRAYVETLGEAPASFARRRSGLYPSLVPVLRAAGFESALHFKFDEGHYPEASQSKTKWQVAGGHALDAYARTPLDAGSDETFLNLPSQLSDTMDTDHVAVRMFLHWPGHAAPWYEDLRRCHRYGTALGKFVTLREFFAESGDAGHSEQFLPDDYRYPFLHQAAAQAQPRPLSQWCDHWQQAVGRLADAGSRALASALGAAGPDELAAALGTPSETELTLVNPFSFPRRVFLTCPEGARGATGAAVYAADQQGSAPVQALVDVPAMGFAAVNLTGTSAALKGPQLAEEWTLKNEFLQATIDPVTGALRAVRDYKSRSTRISQQLALRITLPKTGEHWVDRQAPVGYSVMAADAIEISENGRLRATITTRGRLLAPNGDQVGGFTQRYQVTRGSRVLGIEIELETVDDLLLAEDPWDSYYCARFAFGDETAVMRAGARLQVHDVSRRRIEAPLFVDIDAGDHRTTVLGGGLPYHRRATDAQLDTLLAIPGESTKRFRIGIGVDLKNSVKSAVEFLAGDPLTARISPRADSGWLFHVDGKSVVVSDWSVVDAQSLRLRLTETDGRKARVRIVCARPLAAAHLSDHAGAPAEAIEIVDGRVELDLGEHEIREVVLLFATA